MVAIVAVHLPRQDVAPEFRRQCLRVRFDRVERADRTTAVMSDKRLQSLPLLMITTITAKGATYWQKTI